MPCRPRILGQIHSYQSCKKLLLDGRVDVALPMPAIVYPDLKGYYKNWGVEAYYNVMLETIRVSHQCPAVPES